MFFHLATNQDLESLKWVYSIKASNTKLPHNAALKIKELLLNDQLSTKEFIEKYNKIIQSTQSLPWKSYLYLDKIKNKFLDQASQLSWLQIFSGLVIFGVGFFLYKNFIEKKPKRKKALYSLVTTLSVRFFSLLAYLPPLIQVYRNYLLFLLPQYPSLFLIFPGFMRFAVDIYTNNTLLFSYIYIFGSVFFLARLGPRFYSFNVVFGLMLFILQGVPDSIVAILFKGVELSAEKQVSIHLVLFCIYMSWILPGMYRALTGTYPKNEFLRDAIEIHVGRPYDDEGFKWWNRDY